MRKHAVQLGFITLAMAALACGAFAAAKGKKKNAGPTPPQRTEARSSKFEWQTAPPESQGMSPEKLEAFWKDLLAHQTTGLLVIRNDRIVFERYAEGWDAKKPHGSASMAKAIVGGVSLMVAMNDGRIDPDDRACKYIPEWKDDPLKSKITIRQLATHTSGIEDAEQDNIPHEKLPGWKGAFWAKNPDPFTISRDQAPVMYEPGTSESYSNTGMAMLSYAITASLKGAPQQDVRTLLKERIMDPIGVPADEWSVGYGKTYEVNGLKLVANWGGGSYTARAAARVGRLMLRRGDWDGVQIVESPVVERVTREGLGWWNNQPKRRLTGAPEDAFWGAGAGHQITIVVPSLNLIAVRNGNTLDPRVDYTEAKDRFFATPLIACVTEKSAAAGGAAPPVPPSPVIKGIKWAPVNTITRQANGSDIWATTWAEDDALYTAYGDGWGFDPRIDKKVSMGFARLTGAPPGVRGENIRSQSGETVGDGKKGPKPSGMLCIDGVLYMIVRNTGNSQLAWSEDKARTWTWADWKCEQSFGCPAFVNFGKNYAGARDEYVYIVSHDSDSAYEPADRFVLARAPKDRLREQEAYEFFISLGADGTPVWSRNFEDRGAVFTNPGKCYRTGITYNAGLKRYLWVQVLPSNRNKEANPTGGSIGIYDAPEPWGPWTAVFYTEQWDMVPGETASFPAKWMSADGKKLFLLSSSEDSFTVREAELITK